VADPTTVQLYCFFIDTHKSYYLIDLVHCKQNCWLWRLGYGLGLHDASTACGQEQLR
jgi:hypothetical protein